MSHNIDSHQTTLDHYRNDKGKGSMKKKPQNDMQFPFSYYDKLREQKAKTLRRDIGFPKLCSTSFCIEMNLKM